MSFSSSAVYAASKARLDAGKGDDRDEMIVQQWALNRALTEELMQSRNAVFASLQASNAGAALMQ